MIIHTLVFHWPIIHLPKGQSAVIATDATLVAVVRGEEGEREEATVAKSFSFVNIIPISSINTVLLLKSFHIRRSLFLVTG